MTLHYPFPVIEHINDVLPHIDEAGFRIVEKDGLTFINYKMMGTNVFPPVVTPRGHVEGRPYMIDRLEERLAYAAAVRRECRGIVFDTKSGRIVSRPYQKFFNVGEREDMALSLIDLSKDHTLLEKLDGSMIRPLPSGADIRWGTKMGFTEVGMLAETFVADKIGYYALAEKAMHLGITPLFEFGSRESRIVVDFPEDVMILLDLRRTVTGEYLSRREVYEWGMTFGVPVVDHVDYQGRPARHNSGPVDNIEKIVPMIRAETEGEGRIIAFADGHRAKIKNDAYVTLHRAKERVASERRVAAAVFEQGLDDVLPILSEEDRSRILNWIDDFNFGINRAASRLAAAHDFAREQHATKKDFAINGAVQVPWMRSAIFALWDGKAATPHDAVMKSVRAGMVSDTKFAEMKEELGIRTVWSAINMEDAA